MIERANMPVDVTCRFQSPYQVLGTPCRWLRGNHHGHSTRSDGEHAPDEEVSAYEAAGYDYFALSEHDLFFDPRDDGIDSGMIRLPAVEVTSGSGQTLMCLGSGPDLPPAGSSLAEIAAFVQARRGVFIVDHPNWLYRPRRLHAEVEEIAAADGVDGIEIYTGVIERLPGAPLAVDVWDRLLSQGRLLYGHAVDDQHSALDRFLGWNVVQLPTDGPPPMAADIIESLRFGRFYASTGVTVSRVGATADGRRLEVETDADEVRWIGRDGILVHSTSGGSAALELEELPELPRVKRLRQPHRLYEESAYIRIEARGRRGAMAWSQPFFIGRD